MITVIETQFGWKVRCQACTYHVFPKIGKPNATWTFNGDLERPTFTPSMNETWGIHSPKSRCHFVLTDGVMHYQGDCTHELAGKSMPLEPWPEAAVLEAAALKKAGGW